MPGTGCPLHQDQVGGGSGPCKSCQVYEFLGIGCLFSQSFLFYRCVLNADFKNAIAFWQSRLVFELPYSNNNALGRKIRTERILTSDGHFVFYDLSIASFL